MTPEEKVQNDIIEKNKSEAENSFNSSTKENVTPDYAKDNIKKINQPNREKEQFSRADKIQIGMLILNFGMLFAFVWISFVQISKTNEALKTAGTSNAYTKESIEFTKNATLSSDSSTKHSLAIAESSLVIAQKSFEVNKLTMITSNTAYISAHPRILKFKDDTLIIKIMIKNNGKTPAFNLSVDASMDISIQNYSRVLFKLDSGVVIAPNDSVLVHVRGIRGYMKADGINVLVGRRTLNVEGTISYVSS